MDPLANPRPDPRQRPGGHRVPEAVAFAIAAPGHAERRYLFSADDLSAITTALLYAAGGAQYRDLETSDYWRSLASRLRMASATVRDGGEAPPPGARCYSCGQPV